MVEVQLFGEGRTSEKREILPAMKRGFLGRCPSCGTGRLFRGFARVKDHCGHCNLALHHHRADDLPAYLVILIVGHVVVGAFMGMEAAFTLSMWQHLAIWVPVTVLSSIALLTPVKGAVVGLQWALLMHGFGEDEETLEEHPELTRHEQ